MISFNNLKRNYQQYQSAINDALESVLQSGWYVLGEQVSSFENEFAQYIGCKYCVGVASGTDALSLSLTASGIGNDDEVITTNVTAFPTISAIIQARATPVVVEINSDDGLIDFSKIESKINSRTKAIIPVHLYGQCCEMDKLLELAQSYSLMVIEDAAQAAGAAYSGRKAGSLGKCGAFSFYPTKNLGAIGDGGAITTNDELIYKQLLLLRNYGQNKRYFHEIPGCNSRLDEIQAAVLRAKLKHLDYWNNRRNEIAEMYLAGITSTKHLIKHSCSSSNYHLFVIRHNLRDALQNYLQQREIQTLIHYPVPINKQVAFKWQKNEPFPQSELFTSEILSLPLYPELENEEVFRIIEAINGFK